MIIPKIAPRRARLKIGDRIVSIVIYTSLTLLGILTLYPFWNALAISLNDGVDTASGGITLWPRLFTLDNYRVVFQDGRLITAFFISVARTVTGTAISILLTAWLGYGLAKKELVGRKFYMILCIITLYFSGGLIPTFLLIHSLHMMNSFWVLILPNAINVWNVIIFRTFFQSLPASLEEAARIDGCNYFTTFFRIVLPLSGPIIATLSLFTAVGYWNEWFNASIYITRDEMLPLQNLLINIMNTTISREQLQQMGGAAYNIAQVGGVTHQSVMMATMMVATLPIIIVYPFIQRYFVKGVLVGSLKE